MASCNEHGVYTADEALHLPHAAKGWRGGPIGEIRLADLGTHWIWATSYQMHSGNWEGASSPLSDHEPTPFSNHRAPTREAAINAAGTELRRRLQKRVDERDRDACAVVAWLDTLVPDQLDLFGAVA